MIALGLSELKPGEKDVCTFCGLFFPTRRDKQEAVLNRDKWAHAACSTKDMLKRPANA